MSVNRQCDAPRELRRNKLVLLAGSLVQMLKSVPIALGKHLFPSRTQQLSPAAVTILGQSKPGKIARCRFIKNDLLNGGLFLYFSLLFSQCGKFWGPHKICFVGFCHGADLCAQATFRGGFSLLGGEHPLLTRGTAE